MENKLKNKNSKKDQSTNIINERFTTSWGWFSLRSKLAVKDNNSFFSTNEVDCFYDPRCE